MVSGILGWTPDQFWRATPAELAAIFAAFPVRDAVPLDPEQLEQLKEAFPDG